MAFRWTHAIKEFRWQLDQDSGLPVATIEKIGSGNYVMACNLCGCGHNLLANQPDTGIYAPACTNGDHQILWKFERADWIRRYPDAAKYHTIMLRAVETVDSGDSDQEAIEAEKPAPLEIIESDKARKAA